MIESLFSIAENGAAGGAAPGANNACVLIVDDDPKVLASLDDLVSLHGYSADSAADGHTAIQRLNAHYFNVVLLDLNLPCTSGLEVLEHVVASGADTMVIVVSGESSADVAVRALRSGAYDFIQKPYAVEQLLKTLANAVRKQRLEAENASIQERLVNSEKLHRYMIESSPDLIYMLDSFGRFTFVNERAETLLGLARSHLIGQHYSTIVYEKDLEFARYAFNERRTGKRAASNVELRLKHRQGAIASKRNLNRTLFVELSAMGMYDAENGGGGRRFKGTYGVVRDISERKRAEEIISFQASHDLLTHLPNRFLFKDRLGLAISQARRSGQTFAIMFLDLDRFKIVNDTLGHLIGDELLQAISKRIMSHLRKGDTLARAGGDEYMILLPQAGQRQAAEEIAHKVLSELRQPFVIEGHELFVTVSIGIALYPEHGENGETLIRRADIAMYQVKARGKDGYELYHDGMNVVLSQYVSLEAGMRKAMQTCQFELYYQPQVDVAKGEIIGMEALIRWRHPARGMLLPMEFIPIAEDSGLIVPIGEWVLKVGCQDIRRWREAGLPHVRLAVNFSALQFAQDTLIDTIIAILKENNLPGEALEIEITENAIMKDMEQTVRKLRELASHGIKVAIDDFGTGYASLSYLRRLPIDTLKLDGSFVQDIAVNGAGVSITTAVASMAQNLSLNLVVEGVENEGQMNYLRSVGCHALQGYVLSPPVPSEAAQKLLLEQPFHKC
jgi:diguanylate cyclase (GGDEF)-like protein/PAS domain S-box-containing protein